MVLWVVISDNPRLHRCKALQIRRVPKRAPSEAKTYGLRTRWRTTFFGIRPAWLTHQRKSAVSMPEAFQDIYSRFLPGCRYERYRWRMTAFWEARDTGN
jgi:hypothetical protein